MSRDKNPLASLPIDPALPTAPYYQFAQVLRQRIRDGVLQPGEQLPSIPSLCAASGLSRATVVRGLAELSRSRDIVTRRGSGTFVCEQSGGVATEILVPGERPGPRGYRSEYYDAVYLGAVEGFDDPERRIILSYTYDHMPDLVELESVLRARRADSLMVYRPDEVLSETLKLLSERVPVASLFNPVDGGCVDCAVAGAGGAVRRLLKQCIDEGRRHFAFCAMEKYQQPDGRLYSPYCQMQAAFDQMMEEAGIDAQRFTSALLTPKDIAATKYWAEALPDDTYVVTHVGFSALGVEREIDYVSYTEYRRTLERDHGTSDILYLGLERIAAAAARQLLDRLSGSVTGAGRIASLEPEIVRRGSDLSLGADAVELAETDAPTP